MPTHTPEPQDPAADASPPAGGPGGAEGVSGVDGAEGTDDTAGAESADDVAGAAGGGRAAGPDAAGLSTRDRAVLAMEGRSWPGPGAKERAVRERLGMSPTRYYQVLNALLDDPAAAAYDPVTVNRLRRVRQSYRDTR
jgi:hypothetical protein